MFCSVFVVLCKRSCLENLRVLSILRFMICREKRFSGLPLYQAEHGISAEYGDRESRTWYREPNTGSEQPSRAGSELQPLTAFRRASRFRVILHKFKTKQVNRFCDHHGHDGDEM